jgi:hypothetical protein
MKLYQAFFVVLRVLVILQVILVILKKNIINPDIKIIIDTVLKLGLGGFLYLFFLFHTVPGIEYWDAYILQFAGLVIILDIDFSSSLKILSKISPELSKNLSFLDTIQRSKHD